MNKLVITILCFFGTSVHAGESSTQWRLLQPNSIFVDTYKNQTVHDPYLAPVDRDLGWGAGFNLDLDIAKYNGLGLYWNNLLHFDQSDRTGQIVHGGWQYEIGATVWQQNGLDRVQVFKQHHSRHVFEETRDMHFPVYDRYGVRMRIYP